MNLIGVMQGRLLPPIEGRIQAHPGEQWKEEFPVAQECGLDLIEWIFEGRDWEGNAILKDPDAIIEYSRQCGVRVITLIADFFMDYPLLRVSSAEVETRMTVFENLLNQASCVGVKYLNVPFVDNSEITSDSERDQVAHLMSRLLPQAEKLDMEIALETSLNPEKFRKLLEIVNHPLIKVNYDIGNSAALGYDPAEEMDAYGSLIATVHIKDRVLGGSTVPLGKGDADFDTVFFRLAGLNYKGPFTLQAARDGDEKTATKKYMDFVNNYLNKYLS
jgi:hexulose-6-phosphate isomerase